MATYYRWRQRKVTYSYTTTHPFKFYSNRPPAGDFGSKYYYSNSFPQIKNGKFVLTNSANCPAVGDAIQILAPLYFGVSSTPTTIYYVRDGVIIFYNDKSAGVYPSANSDYSYKYTVKTSYGAETYVYSTSSSAYPNGGVQDGYYYDQRTTVTSPTAPTGLTYPATITTPSVSVSWTAATSATNYPVSLYEVSYSTNGGSSWTVAGTTANASYSVPVPTSATSITFRVRAKDSNNKWGNYVTGTASQVILAPDLTVPQMVMQGQQATISWSAIEGADSYTLQRKSSADADWTQVYSGANLSYSETVGTWTSVQYRVCAVFGSTNGGWAESAAIPVVSASALVISGTDGDLGTIINDIPYSISTDTGNQITATITVNSAVIFSGNVGNSTSETIPVLDLVNGEGTIVIEASVQATSGTVSAVRTWTYTKAPITFPNAGSVAQLTQQGANIWPKTLAECVRLPGGRTLEEVMGFPCQIYTGSYVGTGTYGADNPTILTAPFKPKAAFVSMYQAPGYGVAFLISSDSHATVINNSSILAATVTWEDNSVSFYASSAFGQLNLSGAACHYVIFG